MAEKGLRKIVSLDGKAAALLDEMRRGNESYSEVVKKLTRDHLADSVTEAMDYLRLVAHVVVPENMSDAVQLKLAEADRIIAQAIQTRRSQK